MTQIDIGGNRKKPNIAVIGNPGGWSSERLADTVARFTGKRLLINMEQIMLDLDRGIVHWNGLDLCTLDAIIIKKIGPYYSPNLLDRLEILHFLESRGVRIFSRPIHILRVLDRLSCTIALRIANIPMPPTCITEDSAAALRQLQEYGEAVLKPLYSTKARGMELIEDHPGAYIQLESFRNNNPILYLQKRVNLQGRDLGIVFLGGEYVATYARKNDTPSWNTTTANGGRYVPYTPDPQTIAIAQRAQALFQLDFTSVDVAETEAGPVVFEVSAFGGFKGLKTACNIDCAQLYLDYVKKRIAS
ncbi:GAK system ATP-grasp enzyme [Desulfatirhabdium butyrativorans]|uniref:GAK system ATP-grasp enzyme n=1 Tax=Desulfatirhabdium butyrativorans TaxID=340467 RepID=UPI0003F7A1C1|nr:GAK system ATP-grasp enzyme [Desulfatirhabdium butyrativorans]